MSCEHRNLSHSVRVMGYPRRMGHVVFFCRDCGQQMTTLKGYIDPVEVTATSVITTEEVPQKKQLVLDMRAPQQQQQPAQGSRVIARPRVKPHSQGLGDHISNALATVGITEDRVSNWLGRPCGCKERREKLNRLGAWAIRIMSGKTENAEQYLNEMINEPVAGKGGCAK